MSKQYDFCGRNGCKSRIEGPMPVGVTEGDTRTRNGCAGVLECPDPDPKKCHCHINPPCVECEADKTYCPVCGWAAEEE